MKIKYQLLVCDLDNTLYDWVGYFVPSFYAMLDNALELLNCDKEQLLDDFKQVHQKHHDSEYPFALLETQTVLKQYPDLNKQELYKKLSPVFLEFNEMRKKMLRLHPGVYETLEKLHHSGIKLVAHTEANLFAVIDRLERLKLTHFFEKIYCKERLKTLHPNGKATNPIYESFPYSKIIELSHHQRKPDERVLLEICDKFSILPENTAYVGDSMARDILMASRAKVFSIFAEYGSRHDKYLYEQLVRISHWTTEEIEREIALQKEASNLTPNYKLKNNFSEILIPLGIG